MVRNLVGAVVCVADGRFPVEWIAQTLSNKVRISDSLVFPACGLTLRQVDYPSDSELLERAIAESVAAIEDDGAEVLILGCSAAYWMQPFLQSRLHAMGWEVPVLEGYRCAIEQLKTLVNLRVDASGLAFPSDHPRKWRRRKTV